MHIAQNVKDCSNGKLKGKSMVGVMQQKHLVNVAGISGLYDNINIYMVININVICRSVTGHEIRCSA